MAFGTFFIRSNHKQETRKTQASSSQLIVTSQSDWQEGGYDSSQLDITGDVKLKTSDGGNWQDKNNPPYFSQNATATEYNGDVYAGSGVINAAGHLMKYVVGTNTWTELAAPPQTNHYGFGTANVGDKIYFISGTKHQTIDYSYPVNYVEEYDTISNTWSNKTAIPTARGGLSTVALNGIIYAIGGDTHWVAYPNDKLNTVEAYEPSSDTWSAKTSLTTARSRPAVAAYNGKIYVFGGLTGYEGNPTYNCHYTKSVEIYDPLTNSWSAGPSLPDEFEFVSTDYFAVSAATKSSKIYIVGSRTGSQQYSHAFVFDPLNNSFNTISNPSHQTGNTVVSASDKLVHITSSGEGAGQSAAQTWPSGSAYLPLGVHTSGSTQLNGGNDFFEWQTFTSTYTKPANTNVQFRFRSSTNSTDWGSWTDYQTPASGSPLDITSLVTSRTGPTESPTFYKYLQVETKLTSTDGVSTPTLSDYSIGYHTNRPPNKPVAGTVIIGN